ncbi:TPA: hypothetical protein ACJEU7_002387 [Acinetobacter baumannii]|uniref:hypothetical protein n=1 Tax=Acinetobacter baumannii TaxID=470 RepID=UPI00124A6454|nr:hypothetical protein [Acinetobacter baumannii]KAB1655132.1 hypothetical protein F8B05_21280 [Acinetobacter baumannii]MCX3034157.1 hypothetical protein [Acinetobacter baumannii]
MIRTEEQISAKLAELLDRASELGPKQNKTIQEKFEFNTLVSQAQILSWVLHRPTGVTNTIDYEEPKMIELQK